MNAEMIAFALALSKIKTASSAGEQVTLTAGECTGLIYGIQLLRAPSGGDDGA